MADESLLSAFLTALSAKVQEITDIEVREGYFDGPATDRNVGCIYLPGVGEDKRDVVRENIEARVRLFLVYDRQPEPDVPQSMLPLYDLAEKVQQEMSAGDQRLGVEGLWFVRLTEAEFNPKQYGVEMQFFGWAWNQWAVVSPTL